jgi:hypothetical protein
MKSERLKKLETELNDLQQWMKLGLVPKKEQARHEGEIETLKGRIAEEKDRLQFLKESGEGEEYTTAKRAPAKNVYPDTPTFAEMDMAEESSEVGVDIETESMEFETSVTEEHTAEEGEGGGEEFEEEEEEEEDPFSDQNRWRRGGIVDPDANEW